MSQSQFFLTNWRMQCVTNYQNISTVIANFLNQNFIFSLESHIGSGIETNSLHDIIQRVRQDKITGMIF